MKKFFIYTGVTIAVIFVLLITLPFLFQGKIKEIVKKEANKQLNATLDFKDLNLSFIRNFPDATVSIEDLMLVGTADFASDTLIQSEELSATVNLKSLFGDSGYEVKKIIIKNTSLYAKVLEDGRANWDIMKSEEEKLEVEEDTASTPFSLQLEKISIEGVNITYEDLQAKMKAEIKNFTGTLKGDMTADVTNIETTSSIEALTFIMDNIPYLNNAKIATNLDLQADLKNQKYTIEKSNLDINAIHANIDGWVSMPDTSKIDMDLKVDAPEIQFKDLLSLVPAIYAKDFKDLKAEGEVKFQASAKGTMEGESYPAFEVLLGVANGKFQYPALPKSLNDIQLNLLVNSPGGDLDKTLVDVSKLHFNLGGNPFDLRLKMSHPMTDPNIDLTASGKLNLGMIKDIYPLEAGMQLNGELDANLNFIGAMSMIEKGAYDQFKASGTLGLKGMNFKSEGIPDVLINSAMLAFNPKYAELSNTDIKIGKNDLSASGKLENYIPYFMKDQTLKGSLNVSSNYMNLNDFMQEGSAAPEAQTDAAPVLAFEVPKNLDLTLNANMKEVIFDNIDMKNVTGNIVLNNGKVDMKNLSMNALGGSMKVNGYYSTAENPKQPDVSFGLDLKNVSFAETFKTFDFIKQMAPIFESMTGNYSVNFNIKTPLSQDMSPVLNALTGGGTLSSSDVTITDVPVLNALASALQNESLKTIKPQDMKIPFTIADGRVTTSPFDLNMGVTKMNLSGSTGLDQTIDYLAKVTLPSSLTKGVINTLGVKIGGTFTSPKVSVDTKSLAEQSIASALGGLGVTGLTDSLGNVDLKGAANAQIEKQAEALRQQARDAGAKLVSEAEKQGQKLVDEANKTKNPLTKVAAVAAAQSAANQLKAEAQKQSDNLMQQAEKQITDMSNASKLK